MNGVVMAFLGTLFTFGVTVLGACNVFFVKRDVSREIQSIFLGFAAGVMIAASVWSLLIPGIERAEGLGQNSCLLASVGFLTGVAVLLGVDAWLKSRYQRCPDYSVQKSATMLILAITVHNIPEGMAVGLAFALAAQQPQQPGAISGAIALAVGIGIQNYPEGTAVALPLIKEGMQRKKAFLFGSLSAIVEPVFGVLAAVISGVVRNTMPFLLSLAAGTMVYVVVQELLPEAYIGEDNKSGTLGFIMGFLVMMILDVTLG